MVRVADFYRMEREVHYKKKQKNMILTEMREPGKCWDKSVPRWWSSRNKGPEAGVYMVL